MTESPSRLKIGFTSLAHPHAESYIECLRRRGDVDVLATDPPPYGPDEVRGELLARQWGVDYVDTQDALFAWEPDAVIVTSENSAHCADVERAAAAGVHVLCEKPLATTHADGQRMVRAVERSGILFMLALPVRFAAPFTRLKKAHDDGTLGEIVAVRGSNNGRFPGSDRAWFTDPVLAGGGALMDHVIHIADLLDVLMAAAPVDVTAVSNRILHADGIDVETVGFATITYDNGVIATIDASWSHPQSAPTWGGLELAVASTAGTVSLDVFGPRVTGLDASTGLPIEVPYGQDLDQALIDSFVHALRTETQPEPGIHAAMRTLQVVLAARDSAAVGERVDLGRLSADENS
jgi:1,5-anhydro-D-fructose reductase (1,5-anhydro-D-mannitol-forming)